MLQLAECPLNPIIIITRLIFASRENANLPSEPQLCIIDYYAKQYYHMSGLPLYRCKLPVVVGVTYAWCSLRICSDRKWKSDECNMMVSTQYALIAIPQAVAGYQLCNGKCDCWCWWQQSLYSGLLCLNGFVLRSDYFLCFVHATVCITFARIKVVNGNFSTRWLYEGFTSDLDIFVPVCGGSYCVGSHSKRLNVQTLAHSW